MNAVAEPLVSACSPGLDAYVAFFGDEPEWVHPMGWEHGARFIYQDGDERVVVTIAPDEMEFSLEWWLGKALRTRMCSVMAYGWQIATEDGSAVLHVSYDDMNIKSCQLRLRWFDQIESATKADACFLGKKHFESKPRRS